MQYRLRRKSLVGMGDGTSKKKTAARTEKRAIFRRRFSRLVELQRSAIVWELRTMTGEVNRTQIAPAGPGATLLYDYWYPALRSSKIAGKRMATAMLLGIPLVLGRTTAGRYFAMRDTCPHRGIPLSYGWFDEIGRASCRERV